MSRIIVTGGSGFIGTNLIESLIQQGYEVINYDIKEPKISERHNIWKKVDIRNIDELNKNIIEDAPDYIVHLAARTDLDGKCIADYDSNTIGVENVLKCSRNVTKLKKIIVTSSMLVCKTGYIPKDNFDYNPSTYYGESKVETEKITWGNQPKCDWAIIRPTSIWGPWFDVPYRNFFDMVMHKRYFHIGNKSCTKTYGYVGNAVYEIEQILFNDTSDADNKVFYIGDYEPTNIEEWANEIAKQLGYIIIKVPLGVIVCAAIFGDLLKKIGVKFPMTTFRLKNMTTNNIMNLDNTSRVVGTLPFDRSQGISDTLGWMLEKQ